LETPPSILPKAHRANQTGLAAPVDSRRRRRYSTRIGEGRIRGLISAASGCGSWEAKVKDKGDVSRAAVLLKVILALLAAGFLAWFTADGVSCVTHTFFKYHDEECQGMQFIAAVRVFEHKTLYPDFAAEGAYYPYTPFVPVVSAAALDLFGARLVVLKAFSFAVCFIAMAGVAWGAWGLTRSALSALVAAAIFAGTYRFLDAWQFSIRPDIYGTALGIWGIAAASRALGGKRALLWVALASALFSLAALSKQNFVLLPLAYILFSAITGGRRQFLTSAIASAALIGGAFAWFDVGGEHLYAVTMVLAGQPMKPPWDITDFFADYFRTIAVPLALSLIGAYAAVKAKGARGALWAVMSAAGFLLGFIPYLKEGGTTNSLMFFCAAMAVLAAAGVWRLAEGAGENGRSRIPLALVAPMIFLVIESAAAMSSEYWFAAEPNLAPALAFVERHKDARIYFPSRNYITYIGSGQYYPDDTLTWDRELAGRKAPENVVRMLEKRRFDYIINYFLTGELNSLLDANYRRFDYQLGEFPVYVPKSAQETQPSEGAPEE
jgi:hypothetical protein